MDSESSLMAAFSASSSDLNEAPAVFLSTSMRINSCVWRARSSPIVTRSRSVSLTLQFSITRLPSIIRHLLGKILIAEELYHVLGRVRIEALDIDFRNAKLLVYRGVALPRAHHAHRPIARHA